MFFLGEHSWDLGHYSIDLLDSLMWSLFSHFAYKIFLSDIYLSSARKGELREPPTNLLNGKSK